MKKPNKLVAFLSWWLIVSGHCIGLNSAETKIVSCDFIEGKDGVSIIVYCRNFKIQNSSCTTQLFHSNKMPFNVTELKTVYCAGSEFDESFLNQFHSLEKLDVSSYEFVDFTISEENQKHLNSLKILIASNNNLTKTRRDYFQPMTALTEIDLSRNKINSLDSFTSKNLTLINLAHNKIVYLNEDTFAELFELENLDLSFNLIETISNQLFTNNRMLAVLYLQNNRINTFGCSTPFPAVRILNVANNQRMNTLELLQHLAIDRISLLNLTGIRMDERSVDFLTTKFSNWNFNGQYIGISVELLSCQSMKMIAERWSAMDEPAKMRKIILNCKSENRNQNDDSEYSTNTISSSSVTSTSTLASPLTTLRNRKRNALSHSIPESELHWQSINDQSTTLIPTTNNLSSTTENMNASQFDTTIEPESSSDKKFEYALYAIGAGSVFVVVLVALIIWCFFRKNKKVTIELKPINEENIFESVKNKPDDDFI